jgi:hypothetical protein
MEQVILWACLAFAVGVTVFLGREDWYHVSRPSHSVLATVIGHEEHFDEGSPNYAALMTFAGPDRDLVQVTDALLSALPKPVVGSTITLHYPEGFPEKARVRRPFLRAALYLMLFYLIAVLVGRLLGWLNASGDLSGF